MKNILILLVTLFVNFISYSQESYVKFETTHLNFGKVSVGDTIIKKVKFQNLANDTLVLIAYRENVDNLKMVVNDYNIGPKEFGTIDFIFIAKEPSSVFNKIDFIFFKENESQKYILFSGLVE